MKRTMASVRRLAVTGLVVLAAASVASAFINPKFTPRDLMSQAEMAMVLEIKSMDPNSGLVVATVQKLWKTDANKPAVKEIKIDMLAMGEALSAQGKQVMEEIAGGEKQALFFSSGSFETGAGADEAIEVGKPLGFLMTNSYKGRWVILEQDPNDKALWGMQKISAHLLGTWAGSTDMLVRCLDRTVVDQAFVVPCTSGVEWESSGIARIGNVPGKAFSTLAVDVAGKGQADLFVAADSGDRLFRFNGKVMEDVTAKIGLTSKSQVAAWGDFNGDGKPDLLSYDGKALTLFTQKADGTLDAKPLAIDVKDGVLSLSAVDVGVAGKAGVVMGTKTWPVLLTPQEGGFAAKPVGSGAFPGKDLGAPGLCLVADFDNDGKLDIVQVFSDAGLFYKGTAPGAFAAPVKNSVGAGAGVYGSCLADFDGDGLQDIFFAGDARNRLFQNMGGGQFLDMLGYTGSLEYISKNGGIACSSGDFNNDGRQDLLLVYGTRMATHPFFNRGFRCFGQAREIDLAEQKSMIEGVDPTLFPEASEPQQAGILADFNGDGALDMALVLSGNCQMSKTEGNAIAANVKLYWNAANKVVTDVAKDGNYVGVSTAAAEANDVSVSVRLESGGNVIFFPRKVTKDTPALGVVVSLPASVSAGPVNVIATKGDFRMGGWVVRAGEPGAIIGLPSKGLVKISWILPDGKTGEKTVRVVKDGPVRVNIGKD